MRSFWDISANKRILYLVGNPSCCVCEEEGVSAQAEVAAMNMDVQSLRHLQALRSFIGNLVDQAERACGCDCHKPPSLLLVGPPGAGKTYLVKQMGNVCEMPLYGVHTNQVHSALAVRKLFDQARDNYPSLVFMDDVDAIFSNHDEEPSCSSQIQAIRDELFAQLGSRKLKIDDPKSSRNPTNCVLSSGGGRGATNGVDGSRASSRASSSHSRPQPSAPPDDEEDVFQDDDSSYPDNNGIIVVAATSTPWLLYKDHELLSRFRGVYLVGLPDKQTRYNLLKSLFQNVHHNLTDQDIMVVAEKTEGFTPADLMVVVKTLTYRQFSFLLSMTTHGGSVGSSSEMGSSGSQTPLSSEMSETASESDLDGLPESEGHLKRGTVSASAVAAAMAAAAASGAVPKKDIRPTASSHEKKTVPSPANKPPITLLTNDWDSESEEEEGEVGNPQDKLDHKQKDSMVQKMKAKDSRLPTRVLDDSLVLNTPSTSDIKKSPRDGMSVPSPDSAIGMSKGSEDFIEPKISARLEKTEGPCRTPSESSSSGVTSSGCDSSDSSAIVDDRVQDTCSPPPISSDSETDGDETVVSPSVDSERTTEEKPKESSEEEVKAEKDSIEKEEVIKCDGAQGMVGENKEDLNNEIRNVDEEDRSIGTPVEFELHYSEPPEPMRDDNCAIDSDSDNEISETPRSRGRRVAFSGMSPMEPLSVDVGNDCGPPNVSLDDLPPNITLASSNLPDSHRQESAPNAILLSLLARPSPARSDRHDHPLGEPSDLASFLHPDPDLDENKTSTPIEPLGTLTPTPNLTPTPTPTPSEGSSHNGTVGSSGSGTHASAGSTSSEVHKKEDSDSSFDHSDGHTVPSSDISTATCNETGETMECRTDSDERLQELDDPHDHPDSARGNETKSMARGGLNSLLNIEGLENLTIQIITLAEVLEVVSSGYRSVSDEEIKRYTDFMVWFSNVAKSACPHSKEGSKTANAPPLDDISLDSTVYDTPSIIKKRKGPLRKLGRFLLKALMFILD